MTDIAGRLFDRAVSACKKLDALMAVLALKGSNRTTLMRARDVILEQANELDALRALSEAGPVREGWKLVPGKPNEAMIDAFYRDSGEPRLKRQWFAIAYRDMLSAAPVVYPPNEAAELVRLRKERDEARVQAGVQNFGLKIANEDCDTLEARALAAESRAKLLTEALGRLVDKLDEMEPQVNAVFVAASVHGYRYTGPTYAAEKAAARALVEGETP